MISRQTPISRVKCVVDSCRFYESGNHCVASQIEIQPPDARDTEETDCATFRSRGTDATR
ncbi:MAG: DUF1540 domain-containing protein [Bacillota bacterium]